MKVQLVVLAVVLAVVAARNLRSQEDNEWAQFKAKFGKTYSAQEEPIRRQNYFDMKVKIEAQNLKYLRKESTFQAGVNEFSDMTHEEFVKTRLMKPLDLSKAPVHQNIHQTSNVALPDSVDWRTSNYVTGVKDQGQCGSCWSFSTTGALEGQHAKTTGQLISLSEQNLVDCTYSLSGNLGCDGGWPSLSFNYIRDNGGIDTEASYPYEAVDDICRYNPANNAAQDTGYVAINAKDEGALQDSVANVGPISVLIDASHESYQIYRSGVYYEALCDPNNLDHAVLAVGYGTDNGNDYWLVKNSWGTSWGISGYIEMARNRNNNCGIASEATYPTV